MVKDEGGEWRGMEGEGAKGGTGRCSARVIG